MATTRARAGAPENATARWRLDSGACERTRCVRGERCAAAIFLVLAITAGDDVRRCEGIDASVCRERTTSAWPMNECDTRDPMTEACYCVQSDDCSCAEDAARCGFVFTGYLYRGRGVCRQGVTR
jgi:hypothetical protein